MASAKTAAKHKSEARSSGKFSVKIDKKKKHSSRDKLELEDSGVHLDEPSSGLHSVTSEQDDTDRGVDLRDPTHTENNPRLNVRSSHCQKDQISIQSFSRHCALSAPDLAVSDRITKSESPQPSRLPPAPSGGALLRHPPQQFPPLAGSGIPYKQTLVTRPVSQHCTYHSQGGSTSRQDPVCFTLYPDEEPACKRTGSTTGHKQAKDNRGREKSGKGRFKKILKPLRRSHSAGSAKDVPAHALFLRHDLAKKKELAAPPGRSSVDTGRGSMERQSDDTDSDQEQTSSDSKSSATNTKSKKKTLAQDMKEKFSFLRRRPADGKDGKPTKPSKDMVISWSQSFDNLLKDKVGLEWFRDYLHTEFSEENVEFWIACEDYKHTKSNKLSVRAQEIFTDFVAVQAPREINLDSKTRMATKELVDKPDRQTFEIAQKRIQALMDKDSYPRFLRSEGYQKLLTEYKIQLNLT